MKMPEFLREGAVPRYGRFFPEGSSASVNFLDGYVCRDSSGKACRIREDDPLVVSVDFQCFFKVPQFWEIDPGRDTARPSRVL